MFCLNFRNFTAWFNYTASLKRDPVQPGCGMKNKRQSKTMLRKHVVFHCSSCVHRETTYPDLTWPFKKLCHGRFLRMGRTAKAPGIFALKVCIRLLLNGVGDHTFINLIIIKSNNTESSQTVITVSHSFNISYCLIRSSAGAVPDHAHAHLHAQPPINHSDFSKKKILYLFSSSLFIKLALNRSRSITSCPPQRQPLSQLARQHSQQHLRPVAPCCFLCLLISAPIFRIYTGEIKSLPAGE